MRIRSIRPEFWRSDDIDALDWHDRLLFIGLWSYVDDNGVGRDKLASIAGDLFAGDMEKDSHETLARVSRGLARLSAASLITRYTVDGQALVHIATWDKHQRVDRPGRDRYPLPTCENAVIRESVATDSREVRDTPLTGEGEKGRRGEGAVLLAPRKRDAIWDALMAVCRIDTANIPNSARGAYNRAVADLRAAEATAEQIEQRAINYRTRWPEASLTPTALARRWAEVAQPPERVARSDVNTLHNAALIAKFETEESYS